MDFFARIELRQQCVYKASDACKSATVSSVSRCNPYTFKQIKQQEPLCCV